MFIVITGLDGSGTSSIAEGLHKLDRESSLLKTPCPIYRDRDNIDDEVRKVSPVGHMLYYLSSTVYMSDKIEREYDYTKSNVYVVRYLIDTVVSNRVAGIDLKLDYNIYGHKILEPDLTVFVGIDELIRQNRITLRGKSELDKVLDNERKRQMFIEEFDKLLDKDKTIYVNNDSQNIEDTVKQLYLSISKY